MLKMQILTQSDNFKYKNSVAAQKKQEDTVLKQFHIL